MSDVWSLVTVILCFLTRKTSFGMTTLQCDYSHDTTIRERLRAGALPFQVRDLNGQQLALQVLNWLQRDPFCRPSASSVAQSLFETLVRNATEITSPTRFVPAPAVVGPAELLRFAPDILSKAQTKRSSKSKRSKIERPQTGDNFIDQAQFNALKVAAGDSDASLSFAASVAYAADLVDLPRDTMETFGDVPREVICAKHAIPYVDISETLGHSGAPKELLRVYKTLAKHYHEQSTVDDEG